jgi:hypothetical protein
VCRQQKFGVKTLKRLITTEIRSNRKNFCFAIWFFGLVWFGFLIVTLAWKMGTVEKYLINVPLNKEICR